MVLARALSLAATRAISVDFSSSGYLDVSVPRLSPERMVSDRVAAHDGGWVPHSGIRIEGRLRLPRAYRGLPRPSSTSDAKASAVRPLYLAPSGSPPGRKAWSMMVHVICINGIKKEIAFIRHEDAQAFPAARLQRKIAMR